MNKDVLATIYVRTYVRSYVGVSIVIEQRSIDQSVIISGKEAVTVRTGSPYFGGPEFKEELRFHCIIPLI